MQYLFMDKSKIPADAEQLLQWAGIDSVMILLRSGGISHTCQQEDGAWKLHSDA